MKGRAAWLLPCQPANTKSKDKRIVMFIKKL
jgi:hypothetical protein